MSDQEPASLDIGQVIAATGIPASTLHLWERRGLIEPAGRQGLRRQYPPDVIERLAMIVVCKRASFTLDEIGNLLAPMGLDEDKAPLRRKLAELLARRAQLDQAIEGLGHAVACTEPAAFACPNFQAKLSGVFPLTAPHSPREG